MIYDATDRGSVEVPMMYVDDIDTSADAAPSVPEIETSVTDPSVWGDCCTVSLDLCSGRGISHHTAFGEECSGCGMDSFICSLDRVSSAQCSLCKDLSYLSSG